MKKKQTESYVINYDKISLSNKEVLLTILIAGAILFFVSYIFYRSTLFSFILFPFSIFALKFKKSQKIKVSKNNLSIQFRDFLDILSTNISVGRSIERSLPIIQNELLLLYGDESFINNEINHMIYKLKLNMTIDNIFLDFSSRSTSDDIKNFAMVLSVYLKTGGNFNEIIKNTCKIINDKIEIRQEIDLQITSKKLESRIMGIMPIILIIILSTSTGDFMLPIFTTIYGRLIMSIALAIILFGNFIAYKITDIKV